MSVPGLKVAKLFGEKLPAFKNISEAESYFYQDRDNLLKKLANAAKSGSQILDYSQESLKVLEKWYFTLWERNEFQKVGFTREEFESCLAIYFGETATRNVANTHWIVQEFPFTKGKFEMGVKKGLFTMMLSRFTNHFASPSNKRRDKIFRTYQRYFGR